jgi:hypothetical protein
MDWQRRGYEDFGNGVPRVAKPNDGSAGEEWLRGWDEAAARVEDDEPETYETIPVRLEIIGGKLMLCDRAGRVIGTQAHIAIETGETGYNVSVTFADIGLEIPKALIEA